MDVLYSVVLHVFRQSKNLLNMEQNFEVSSVPGNPSSALVTVLLNTYEIQEDTLTQLATEILYNYFTNGHWLTWAAKSTLIFEYDVNCTCFILILCNIERPALGVVPSP